MNNLSNKGQKTYKDVIFIVSFISIILYCISMSGLTWLIMETNGGIITHKWLWVFLWVGFTSDLIISICEQHIKKDKKRDTLGLTLTMVTIGNLIFSVCSLIITKIYWSFSFEESKNSLINV